MPLSPIMIPIYHLHQLVTRSLIFSLSRLKNHHLLRRRLVVAFMGWHNQCLVAGRLMSLDSSHRLAALFLGSLIWSLFSSHSPCWTLVYLLPGSRDNLISSFKCVKDLSQTSSFSSFQPPIKPNRVKAFLLSSFHEPSQDKPGSARFPL